MASEELQRLHKAAHKRWPSYQEARTRWQIYEQFALNIARQLPFRWHVELVSNPTQNHTGRSNGGAHIMADETIHIGRLKRNMGQSLCPDTSRLGRHYVSDYPCPTCKKCLEVAEKIVGTQ